MIKLTRYRDPWSDDPEMNCYRPEYPYGELIEPLIEQKEAGYFAQSKRLSGYSKERSGQDLALRCLKWVTWIAIATSRESVRNGSPSNSRRPPMSKSKRQKVRKHMRWLAKRFGDGGILSLETVYRHRRFEVSLYHKHAPAEFERAVFCYGWFY